MNNLQVSILLVKKVIMEKIYIETSVISYLTARPSRDLITAAQQQITSIWWEEHRSNYALYVSTLVIEEASGGDPLAAQRRLRAIDGIEVLEVTDDIINLAALLIEKKVVPRKAVEDAYHIAIACIYEMQYLITWNYRHIANATMREAINKVCREAGYKPPVICTIAELGE